MNEFANVHWQNSYLEKVNGIIYVVHEDIDVETTLVMETRIKFNNNQNLLLLQGLLCDKIERNELILNSFE